VTGQFIIDSFLHADIVDLLLDLYDIEKNDDKKIMIKITLGKLTSLYRWDPERRKRLDDLFTVKLEEEENDK